MMTIKDFGFMRRGIGRRALRCALGALLVVLLPLTAWAQEAQEMDPWTQVRIIEVKRDRLAEWEDMVKELVAASAEAGLPPAVVYEEVRGTMNTFHVVQSFPALAELDEDMAPPMPPAEMAAWESRVAATEVSHRVLITQTFPDYSVQTDTADSAEFLMLRTVRTAPGRAEDYEAWVADELVPALREAGQAHTLSRGFLGGDIGTWYHTLAVENWAAFDGPNPLVETLGEEGFAELIEGVDAMVARHEAILLRPRPDLSSPSE